jgi:hypothetical protein
MKYRVKRLITKKECTWLDNDVKEGTIVHKFHGHTYGCISPNGIAITFHLPADNTHTPFFELPRDALEFIGE